MRTFCHHPTSLNTFHRNFSYLTMTFRDNCNYCKVSSETKKPCESSQCHRSTIWKDCHLLPELLSQNLRKTCWKGNAKTHNFLPNKTRPTHEVNSRTFNLSFKAHQVIRREPDPSCRSFTVSHEDRDVGAHRESPPWKKINLRRGLLAET